VTSCAGFPLDKTYYQTVKGMVTPLDILEPGGTLIIASECSEGLGSHEFRECQKRLLELRPDGFLKMLRQKSLADIDEWGTEMLLKPMRVGRVQLYSTGLTGDDRRLTGVDMSDSVDEAVCDSIERSGDGNVAVIPEGPYVVPFYAEQAA
jgi:nickel-dependent lactate racemase